MLQTIDGFYAAYLTAAAGNGMALLVFRAGQIVGADIGGVKYDGSYSLESTAYRVEVVVSLPPNIPLVQGVTSGPLPETYTLNAVFPADFTNHPFIRIDGKNGPVNAKFVKLRELDDE